MSNVNWDQKSDDSEDEGGDHHAPRTTTTTAKEPSTDGTGTAAESASAANANASESSSPPALDRRMGVFVSNLSFAATLDDVGDYFYNNGCAVADVELLLNQTNGKPSGTGKVYFGNWDSVDLAVTFDGKELKGRAIHVEKFRKGGGGGDRDRSQPFGNNRREREGGRPEGGRDHRDHRDHERLPSGPHGGDRGGDRGSPRGDRERFPRPPGPSDHADNGGNDNDGTPWQRRAIPQQPPRDRESRPPRSTVPAERDSNNNNNRRPPRNMAAEASVEAAASVRKPLQLLSRSKPIEEIGKPVATSPSIFGEGKAQDIFVLASKKSSEDTAAASPPPPPVAPGVSAGVGAGAGERSKQTSTVTSATLKAPVAAAAAAVAADRPANNKKGDTLASRRDAPKSGQVPKDQSHRKVTAESGPPAAAAIAAGAASSSSDSRPTSGKDKQRGDRPPRDSRDNKEGKGGKEGGRPSRPPPPSGPKILIAKKPSANQLTDQDFGASSGVVSTIQVDGAKSTSSITKPASGASTSGKGVKNTFASLLMEGASSDDDN